MPEYVLSVDLQDELGQRNLNTDNMESVVSINHFNGKGLQVLWKYSEDKYIVEDRNNERLKVVGPERAAKLKEKY